MAIPEKLPFTALAGIVAAAVQASGAVTGFFAACTWSLVILTAAVEAALGFSAKRTHWRWWQRWITAVAAIMIAIFAVGVLDWQAYRKEYLTDDLRVNFQVPHPIQVGTDELALNFLVATKAPASILLEETVAVEVASTDFSNNPGRDSAFCKLLPSYIVGKSVTENWLHPGQKVLHHSMDRPANSLPEANGGFTPNPPFADDGKIDLAYYDPKSISVDGKEIAPGPISVAANKPVGVTAVFETDPAPWATHNVLTVCGAIRYLSSDGRDTWVVCPAQGRAQMYENGKATGEMSGPFATTPFVIGGNSSDSRCGLWKGL
jgi:hypothetical protein